MPTPASKKQREKVKDAFCVLCGKRPVDPAHLVPRSLGGCEHPDCVIPLCRPHHRDFDEHRIPDFHKWLEPTYRAEMAHALFWHGGLEQLIRRMHRT